MYDVATHYCSAKHDTYKLGVSPIQYDTTLYNTTMHYSALNYAINTLLYDVVQWEYRGVQ